MLTSALTLWAAMATPAPVACDPANGGWQCVATARSAPHPHPAAAHNAPNAPDPNAICLASNICDQLAIDPRPAHATTADIALMAINGLQLLPPTPWTDPSRRTWVGLRTYLHLDPKLWRPVQATASAGDQTVTATAGPLKAVWDLGETTLTCTSATCDHTFLRASLTRPGGVQQVTVTLYYSINWTCSGRCDQRAGSLDPLTTTGRTSLQVAEIQTITEPGQRFGHLPP